MPLTEVDVAALALKIYQCMQAADIDARPEVMIGMAALWGMSIAP